MSKRKVLVIGGGASGIMAAISASIHGADVTIYEKNDRVGKKILMTGNGRCNFSNRDIGTDKYYGSCTDKLCGIFEIFGQSDTERFFEDRGMLLCEKNGYMYPYSMQASTVLDILRIELKKRNINVVTQESVNSIIYANNKYKIGNEIFDSVIVCTGLKSYPQTGSDGSGLTVVKSMGIKCQDTVPALCALKCKESFYKSISGVRHDAVISLYVNDEFVKSERGELQLTDYGISGIAVFGLSRIASYALKKNDKVYAYIDMLPILENNKINDYIRNRLNNISPDMTLEEFMTGVVNKKIVQLIIRLSEYKFDTPVRNVDGNDLIKLFENLKQFKTVITGNNDYKNSQVTAGGVLSKELTIGLESINYPGLFFAGEICDIDGICGGYNLQWAFSSGYVAGMNAASN